ncbi:hypothetical protein C2857_006740 [Epichloe festucae Fl1]|uniref:Deoxyribonuclease NucA/NucB domain-containing protein n=1 Tax=Epichloe festucae (strain Fl1) TaxID=877507 RepID=A0A7S9PSS9_EPIFF|nr:hypothetical protein C2857_006740 [Epichloe festucae Fl1]
MRFTAMCCIFITGVYTSSTPDITFKCRHMPEICTNMCWAMRCAEPRFPQTLTWDNRSVGDNVMYPNLKASGCKIADNRCREHRVQHGSMEGVFSICDEYPFYFTLESGLANGHAVSRCVRRNANRAQAKSLRATYTPWRKQGLGTHKLQVGIADPGYKGVNYCLNQPCVNDGFEMQDGMAKIDGVDGVDGIDDRREPPPPPPPFRFFKTASGNIMASLDALTLGVNFTRALHDDEEEDEDEGEPEETIMLDRWAEEVEGARVRFVSDVLLEEVSAEHAALVDALVE